MIRYMPRFTTKDAKACFERVVKMQGKHVSTGYNATSFSPTIQYALLMSIWM